VQYGRLRINTHSYISLQRFSFDLNVKEGHNGYDTLHKSEKPLGMKAVQSLELDHNNNNHSTSSSSHPVVGLTQAQQTALTLKKKQKAMSIAMAPGQQIAMNAFMMYMSGSGLNIFSISVTSTAILSPLHAISTMQTTFQSLGDDLQMPKLLFVGLNLVWLAVGMYKLNSMKLLPMTSADWTGTVVWKEMMETSSIPPESFYSYY
jgi:ER membrane protein complex subunit 4